MKKITSSLLVFVLASISCNLTAPRGTTTAHQGTPSVLPVSSPTPTLAPFSPPDPKPFFTSLSRNLQARVDAGEWTLEEGLVSSMKFLAGEDDMHTVDPSGVDIHNLSGSGVLRMANAYLKSGKDAATKTELRRLIALILPDPDNLHQYSRPYQANTGSGSTSSISYNQQSATCSDLWKKGFPAGSTQACFEERTVSAAGQTYKIYYPISWAADDPRRAFFEPTAQAVGDAVAVFSKYGTMPSTTIVFTLLPASTDPEDTDAATLMPDPAGPCRIAVLPPGTSRYTNSVDIYKQIIAHELFHCYQYNHYYNQIDADGSDWWVEGTAVYFSNVVYPQVNQEAVFWTDFDNESLSKTLLEMDYDNEVFFQYLANRIGDAGVLKLISGMPSSGDQSEQQKSLSAFPKIDSLFHDFAKAYLDKTIEDTGGGSIRSIPRAYFSDTFNDSRKDTIGFRSFELARAVFFFPKGKKQALSEENPDGTTSSAETRGAQNAWGPLPAELTPACSFLTYIYTATRTTPDAGSDNLKIVSVTTDFDGGCDTCLVGKWQEDTQSQWQAFQRIMQSGPAMPELQSISGSVTARFLEDGNVMNTFTGFSLQYSMSTSSSQIETQMILNGVQGADWYTDKASGLLTFSNVDASLLKPDMTITENGTKEPINGTLTFNADGSKMHFEGTAVMFGITFPISLDIPFIWGGHALYKCDQNTLLLDPYTPYGLNGQYITWTRLP